MISAIVSVTAVIVLLQHKQEVLQRDLDREERQTQDKLNKLTIDIEGIKRELTLIKTSIASALQTVSMAAKEQALVNKVTTNTLDSLMSKLDKYSELVIALERDVAVLKEKFASHESREDDN